MSEISTDARKIVLLLQLKHTCLQILRNALCHLPSFDELAHFVLVYKVEQAGHAVAVAPNLRFDCFVFVVGLEYAFI